MAKRATLFVFVANPEEPFFEGEAQKVALWTGEGEVVILPNHAPYAATLLPERSIRIVTADGEEVPLSSGARGGLVSVFRNAVHILLG